ncbi:hypothetical protein B0H19DRAFT_1058780 [Mycena capillaripes]|nr:hypothetical protein B0H19DRAFT_1058780 [Mycena capillaripes]
MAAILSRIVRVHILALFFLLVALLPSLTAAPFDALPAKLVDIDRTSFVHRHPDVTPHATSSASVPAATTLPAILPVTTIDANSTKAHETHSTGGTSVMQQLSVAPHATSPAVPVSWPTIAPRKEATPSQVLIPQLDRIPAQQSSAATPSATTPTDGLLLMMDGGSTLSQRVIMGIIVVVVLGLGAFMTFCCFSRGCGRRPPPPELPHELRWRLQQQQQPQRGGVVLNVVVRPPETSDPRLSSVTESTLASEAPSHNKDSATEGEPSSHRLSSTTATTLTSESGVPSDNKDSTMDGEPFSPRLNEGCGTPAPNRDSVVVRDEADSGVGIHDTEVPSRICGGGARL